VSERREVSLREARIEIRAKLREAKAWRDAAKRADETLSEWARARLNLAASPTPEGSSLVARTIRLSTKEEPSLVTGKARSRRRTS